MIAIIGCSSRKNKGTHKAKELYTGNFVNTPIKYYNHFNNNNYYFLSAKYGVIKCDTIIENYNISFNDEKSITSKQIANKFNDPNCKVEFIGGKKYIAMLQKAWPNSIISNPFISYGINYQGMWRRALKDALNNKIEIHTWLKTNKNKYIPTKLTNEEVKQWIYDNYHIHRSMVKLAHVFRDSGFSCDEHRWERLYKEVKI
jgi:hypothetical protein